MFIVHTPISEGKYVLTKCIRKKRFTKKHHFEICRLLTKEDDPVLGKFEKNLLHCLELFICPRRKNRLCAASINIDFCIEKISSFYQLC